MKRYKGSLAKPFDELKLGFGAGAGVSERVRKQTQLRTTEIGVKMCVLINHFGIDYDDPHLWVRLALELAKRHVRGFQERRTPGAKRQWTIFKKWDLKKAVDRKIDEAGTGRGKGVTWACEVLAKVKPWKTLLANNKKPAEVLRHTYYAVSRDIENAEQRSAPTQK